MSSFLAIFHGFYLHFTEFQLFNWNWNFFNIYKVSIVHKISGTTVFQNTFHWLPSCNQIWFSSFAFLDLVWCVINMFMDFGVRVIHARYLTHSQTCISVVILMIFIGTSFNSFMCYHVIIISYICLSWCLELNSALEWTLFSCTCLIYHVSVWQF